MNLFAAEGTSFDIKANGDGTFRVQIDVSSNLVYPFPTRVTIPRCSITFTPYFNEDKAEHPYIVEVGCDELDDARALFTISEL